MVSSQRAAKSPLHASQTFGSTHGNAHAEDSPTPAGSRRVSVQQPRTQQEVTNSFEKIAKAGHLPLSSYLDPLDEEDAAFLVPDDERWQASILVTSLLGF